MDILVMHYSIIHIYKKNFFFSIRRKIYEAQTLHTDRSAWNRISPVLFIDILGNPGTLIRKEGKKTTFIHYTSAYMPAHEGCCNFPTILSKWSHRHQKICHDSSNYCCDYWPENNVLQSLNRNYYCMKLENAIEKLLQSKFKEQEQIKTT